MLDTPLRAQVAQTDEGHWWSEGRRRIVGSVLRRHLPPGEGRRILELGGGGEDSGMTQLLGEFGTVSTEVASGEGVDVIAAFDVLERARDDRRMLAEFHRRLRPGGTVVLTVAAFEFLWGPHDELCEHRRRYGRGELRRRLEDAGFDVELVSYFGTWLFPAVSARAVLRRFRGWTDPRPDFVPRSAPVNRALQWLVASEAPLIGRWSPPAGIALVALARKP